MKRILLIMARKAYKEYSRKKFSRIYRIYKLIYHCELWVAPNGDIVEIYPDEQIAKIVYDTDKSK